MTIKDRMYEEMKVSMKAGDKIRTEALRMTIALLKKEAIDTGKELDEAAELGIVRRCLKQRREAAEAFDKAGRQELAAQERREAEVLSVYLPQQLSDAELDEAVKALVSATGASSPKDLGKLMGPLLKRFGDRLDGQRARAAAAKALGG